MAKVKITGHASGTGVVTITAPNTSTDRTITLPDATGSLSTFDPDGAVVINETGADVDFRVESDTNTHALFVQGSDGNVGIGTTAPILGKVHLLAAGTSDASLENVAHLGKNSTSRAGLQIRANATLVDVGMQAQAGAGNLDLSLSSLAGGAPVEGLKITSDGRGLSQFTAKSWVNFNGQGTVAIRDSHNCSSITDNGTGDYTVNFSNNMGNTNFATVSNGGKFGADVVSDLHAINIGTQAVGSVRVGDNYANGGSVRDPDVCSLMVFGD